MLNDASRIWLIGGAWFAAVAFMIACSVAVGATLSTSALLLVMGMAPAVVVMVLNGAGSSPTAAQILYSVNAKDGR